jgi:hypothetical protein
MKLFSYKLAKENTDAFLSMTSLNVEEFDELCVSFGECWNEYTKANEKDPKKGGRPPALTSMEDRLFFILFYLKTYPLQEVLAFSFEISQSEANKQIYILSHVLNMTLEKLGFKPPRLSDEMLAKLKQENPQDYSIDGVERPIIRPSNNDVQQFFFSGKKRRHTVKNDIAAGINDYQIKWLSETCEGKKHDKKICDDENIRLPKGANCYYDAGFQGLKMEGVNIYQPKKKPCGGELTPEEKKENRDISSIRVAIEHIIAGIKRCRIVKDILRNTTPNYDDVVMELACSLHNFRTAHRRHTY